VTDEINELWPDIDEGDDKRSAAVHEAGHVVVAAIRDGKMYGALIERSVTETPQSKRIWIGKTRGIDWAGGISAAMSVAGAVAEILDEQNHVNAAICMERIACGMNPLSETDLRGYPAGYSNQLKACEDALTTLREYPAFFRWAVNQLLDDDGNLITDGMVREYLESSKP
jgi:hypothetical protein